MAKRILKRKNDIKKNSSFEVTGVVLIAVAIFFFLVIFEFSLGSLGTFINKLLRYSFGKLAIVIPISLLVIGIRYAVKHIAFTWNKQFFSLLLLLLCSFGLFHIYMVPFGQELQPELLPLGGGLVGGALLLVLRNILGGAGALIALSAGALSGVILTGKFSIKTSVEKAEIGAKLATDTALKTVNIVKTQIKGKRKFYDQENAKQFPVIKTKLTEEMAEISDVTPKEDITETINTNAVSDEILTDTFDGEKMVFTEPIFSQDVLCFPSQAKVKSNSATASVHTDTIINDELTVGYASNDNGNVPEEVISIKITNREQVLPKENPITSMKKVENNEITLEAGTAYKFPPLDLLEPIQDCQQENINVGIANQSKIIEQTLNDFNVKATILAVSRGPSVTRFELAPAPGVKVSKIVNLSDDLALKLAAPGIRIEPVPGKAAIGVEVPNIVTDSVQFRSVMDSEALRAAKNKLCVAMGRDISGNVIIADLAKMPHLLVAGSTGSGKSVCINTIIAGLLFRTTPEEVKLILVDPKVVELTNYNGIPHLLTPVVTNAKQAASALHWAVAEMERRYTLFADAQVRDINRYNENALEKLPFIVIIIDELADLMMVAAVDVEDAILRLAQKARAAGIHLILATQRPSVDVITGIIKANIPSRIAFAVSSQTDSRTILDMSGAEKLLGKGDMLFYPIGASKPQRVQGAFVSDGELDRLVDFIKEQAIPTQYSETVTTQTLASDAKKNISTNNSDDDFMQDELFEDAVRLVMDTGQASSSMLQRKFRIGYTRAARLVDTMEELGIIGAAVGSKPREVLMSNAEILERYFSNNE